MADEKAKTTRGAQATNATVEDRPQTPTPATEKQPAAEQAQAKQEKIAAKDFAPINPDDEKANPVKVEVPRTAEEIAKEGTALGNAGSADTGGNVPFLAPATASANRKWTLSADHNVNLRGSCNGPGAVAHPDLVELG